MSLRRNLANQVGMALGEVAEYEKSRPRVRGFQDLENPATGKLDPRGVRLPLGTWDLKPLIPVLEVDTERVDHAWGWRPHGIPRSRFGVTPRRAYGLPHRTP